MSDTELLERAIDRLEVLAAASTPGPWEHPKALLGIESNAIFGSDGSTSSYVASSRDADLIVALHGTIPAMLAILKEGLAQATLEESYPLYWYAPAAKESIALARAILGEPE